MKQEIDTQKVKNLVEEHNVKGVDFANAIEMAPPNLSMILNGKRSFPMKYVFDIASFFDVDPSFILTSNDSEERARMSNTTQEERVS